MHSQIIRLYFFYSKLEISIFSLFCVNFQMEVICPYASIFRGSQIKNKTNYISREYRRKLMNAKILNGNFSIFRIAIVSITIVNFSHCDFAVVRIAIASIVIFNVSLKFIYFLSWFSTLRFSNLSIIICHFRNF